MATATPAEAAPAARKCCGVTFNNASNMIFLSQVAAFCLYGGCTTFADEFSVGFNGSSPMLNSNGSQWVQHVFIALFVFAGLGYTFITNIQHSWQTLGYSLALGATAVQWSILLLGFWDFGKLTRTDSSAKWPAIPLQWNYLLNSLYVTATVLVSFGALAGRLSFTQAFGVAFFEIFFATANYIIAVETKVLDFGGAFSVHIFGAAFGLAAGLVACKRGKPSLPRPTRSKEEGIFVLLGAILLFVTYPVFNIGNQAYLLKAIGVPAANINVALAGLGFRGYFNTIMSMASALAAAFMYAKATSPSGTKFTIWQAQIAAIAGGAAVASYAGVLRNPYGAIMTGAIVGIIALFFQAKIAPCFAAIGCVDTSSILSGHLIPGLLGAVGSAIAFARVTDEERYSQAIRDTVLLDGRTAKMQGGYQIAYAIVCLVFGLLAGVLANLPCFSPKDSNSNSDDATEFDDVEAGPTFPGWSVTALEAAAAKAVAAASQPKEAPAAAGASAEAPKAEAVPAAATAAA